MTTDQQQINSQSLEERYSKVVDYWKKNPMTHAEAQTICKEHCVSTAMPTFMKGSGNLVYYGLNETKRALRFKAIEKETRSIVKDVLLYASKYHQKSKTTKKSHNIEKRMKERIRKNESIIRITSTPLSSFTIKELIDELKRRGASGEINFKQTVRI